MNAQLHVEVVGLSESNVECNETLCSEAAFIRLTETRCYVGTPLVQHTVVFVCERHVGAYIRNGATCFADQYLVSRHKSSPRC